MQTFELLLGETINGVWQPDEWLINYIMLALEYPIKSLDITLLDEELIKGGVIVGIKAVVHTLLGEPHSTLTIDLKFEKSMVEAIDYHAAKSFGHGVSRAIANTINEAFRALTTTDSKSPLSIAVDEQQS